MIEKVAAAGKTVAPVPVPVSGNASALSQKSQGSPPAINPVKLDKVVRALNKFFSEANKRISLEVDTQINRPIIRVVSTEDNRVIKQVPSEEVVEMLHKFEELLGLFINETR